MVLRRDQEAGDHQLPHLQAGARRPVLRPHLRADQGLRVPVRQVQAHEVQGHHLRKVLGRSDAVARPSRAHGPYRTGRAGRAHLVPEVAALAHRPTARHDAEGSRADPVFRILRRSGAGSHRAQGPSAAVGRRVSEGAGRIRPGQLHRHDRRRGDPRTAEGSRARKARGIPACRDAGNRIRHQAQEARQAPEDRRGVPLFRQQAGMDDPDRGAGDSAGPASAGAARRRPLCDLGSQRSLPPRHQPQQPPEAADGAARARHHHPQRKAHAAGGGRRIVRQRPPRPRHHRRQQASAEVAGRHAQGQAGPLPAEPARQARRLFRPFGDRGRSRTASCISAACRRRWRSNCSSRSSIRGSTPRVCPPR